MAYRGAVLDVDGTVLRGESAIPGAAAAIDALDARGIARLFVSNNPIRAPPAYAEKLRAAGFDVEADDVLTSGSVTAEYLREHHAADPIHVVGEAGLREQLRAAGLDLVDPEEAAVCVASIDRRFSYDHLEALLPLVRRPETTLVGTDPDAVIPGPDGDFPGSGAIIAPIAAVAERDPDAVLGKPHPLAREMALDRLGVAPEECLVVGDRLDTDIALGADCGMTTVLVRTGVTDDDRLAASDVAPDYVLDSIADVERVLDD